MHFKVALDCNVTTVGAANKAQVIPLCLVINTPVLSVWLDANATSVRTVGMNAHTLVRHPLVEYTLKFTNEPTVIHSTSQ